MRIEVAGLENRVNDLENQIKTLEYVNGEFANQERQFRERIDDLEGQLEAQHLEPSKSVSPAKVAKSVSPEKFAKSVSPAKPTKSVVPAKRVIEFSEDSESSEDQSSP